MLSRLVLVTFALGGVVGCASTQRAALAPTPSSPAVAGPVAEHVVDLEPMRIEVVRGERGEARVVAFDARELFDAGNTALDNGDHDRALALYDQMLAAFPDSALAAPARFNAGLALEGKRDLDGAVARYDAVLAGDASPRDAGDAELRAGVVRAEQGRTAEALERFERVLARKALAETTRLEAMARKGHALLASRDLAAAEAALVATLAFYEEVMLKIPLEGNEFVGMAYFDLAEIPHRQFVALPVRLPDAQLQKDIEAKAGLVMVAQERYEDTIGFGNLHWATAAGFQIAAMQEEFWQALVSAPIPPQLSAAAAAVYVREVRGLARSHLEKALHVHQKNVELAEVYRTSTEFSARSRVRAIEVAEILARDAAGELAPASALPPSAPSAADLAPPELWVPPAASF